MAEGFVLSGTEIKMNLTILTEPVTMNAHIKELCKGVFGKHRKYGGHYAVTRSLIEGLDKIGYEHFNYRPKSENDIFENVHVLAGVSTLKYALAIKKKGKIKHLSAGPNVVVFSTDHNKLICDKDLDFYVQPCGWAARMHKDMAAELENKCFCWPAGVDIDRFCPSLYKDRNSVLIYYKEGSRQFMWLIEYHLRMRGFHTMVIEYGKYEMCEYIDCLARVSAMVVIGGKESQGLFLAEAWAMDVPTMCYETNYYRWEDENRLLEIRGDQLSCPYLSDETGEVFSDMKDLDAILDQWDVKLSGKSPRRWVEMNMTDEVCARQFVWLLEKQYGEEAVGKYGESAECKEELSI